MQRAAELDLALDIGDAAAAEANARGDPGRLAKGELTELQDREPIDLADLRAGRVDQDEVALDPLLGTVA